MVNKAAAPWVEGSAEPSLWARQLLRSARERLDEIAQLPDDWDSYGAVRPTTEAVSAAQDLLTALWAGLVDAVDQTAVPWAVAPLADGGVQFEWRRQGGAIEVEIAPHGMLNYLVERDERTVRRSDPHRGAPRAEVLDQLRRVLARS